MVYVFGWGQSMSQLCDEVLMMVLGCVCMSHKMHSLALMEIKEDGVIKMAYWLVLIILYHSKLCIQKFEVGKIFKYF